jgi:electron transport complex protein RnfB
MADDVFKKLAQYLDRLPGGYPGTGSGVEIRILQKLFSPEEADLALHLTLIAEEPRVIAYRAGIPLDNVIACLHEMDRKGLIFSIRNNEGIIRYRIQQFVIGFWEAQVNRLYPELVEDFEEYLDSFVDLDLWQKAPQLRTIPVEESVSADAKVLPYERVDALIRAQKNIVVNNCICRQEMRLIGKGCDRPLESCFSFGEVAERMLGQGRGREVTHEEALEILRLAEKNGLVLQTGNSRKVIFLCTCCSCCCGVLRSFKKDPEPGIRLSSPFIMNLSTDTCTGCGMCEDRCPMDAIRLEDGVAVMDMKRCIGCGLCVSTCPTNSCKLVRKKKSLQPYIPRNPLETYIRIGQVSGRMKLGSVLRLQLRSTVDRWKTARRN